MDIDTAVLELTNHRNFYENFTIVLRTGYENGYSFDHDGLSIGLRTELLSEISRYSSRCSMNKVNNNNLLYALISHYSEEVFGQHVRPEDVKKFIDNGYKYETGPDVKYVRAKWDCHSAGKITKGKVYRAVPHDKHPWVLPDDNGHDWTTDLDDVWWEEVTEQDYLAQGINQHLDNAKESFNKVHNDLKQVGETTMAMKPQDVIETQVNVFGENAANMTDDQCFDAIAKVEKEIDRLTNVTSKSTKLKARVQEMKNQLQALVDYVDNRD